MDGEWEYQRETTLYITSFGPDGELVNLLTLVPISSKNKVPISEPSREVTEDDKEEPLIIDIVKPNFDDPQLKEKVNQVTEQILTFQHNLKGKVTRQNSKKRKQLFLNTTKGDLK